jgi:hypothetical protein
MTENTVSEIERMVVTRVFDAPRELVWKAWTDPKYVMQWWGPKGFTAPVCQMDFRVGGKFLCCMKAPGGVSGGVGRSKLWPSDAMDSAQAAAAIRYIYTLRGLRRFILCSAHLWEPTSSLSSGRI